MTNNCIMTQIKKHIKNKTKCKRKKNKVPKKYNKINEKKVFKFPTQTTGSTCSAIITRVFALNQILTLFVRVV